MAARPVPNSMPFVVPIPHDKLLGNVVPCFADMPWPLANILTIVLASLTAAIVLLIVVYLCARSWVVRRERARRRARRREIRAARLAGQRQVRSVEAGLRCGAACCAWGTCMLACDLAADRPACSPQS